MVDDTPLLSCMASDGVSLSLASTTFELADVLGAKAAPPYVEVYERDVAPVLAAAGVAAEVLVTKSQGEGYERCKALGAWRRRRVAVGGDGTMSEVVRGLVDGCATTEDPAAKLRAIRVAHAPGGSGNACHASVAHAGGDAIGSAVDVAFNVCRGSTRALDLARYDLGGGKPPFYSFLALEWGLVADIDLGSENMRWLGPLRFTLAALYRIACLRDYKGTLAYLPAAPELTREAPSLFAPSRLPPLDAPLPEGWAKEDDDETFHLLMACNTTHVDETTPIAPDAQLDDGAISLVYTKGKGGCGTKLDLLDGFLKLDSADHVHKASFHVVKCAAFRLTPAAGDTSRAGIDGEEVQNGPVQAEAFKACLAVFAAEASPTGTDAA
ncbi:D-erythro-sphingosine kinase [Aureococcus anophagefferens]|nr:D-erythro-sphingosine kinase [Aureococcus anophagefferens]